jgi:hypothetical protein
LHGRAAPVSRECPRAPQADAWQSYAVYVEQDIDGTIYPARLCRVALKRSGKRLSNIGISCRSVRTTRHSQLDLKAVQEFQQIVVGPEAG